MSDIRNCDTCKYSELLAYKEPCCYCTSLIYCTKPYEKWEPKKEEKNE